MMISLGRLLKLISVILFVALALGIGSFGPIGLLGAGLAFFAAGDLV